jgi:hypothetical protein
MLEKKSKKEIFCGIMAVYTVFFSRSYYLSQVAAYFQTSG